jgi:predicted transcriptional regulator
MSLPIAAQKKIFPQEIEVWYVFPAIRKAFAITLMKHGLSQRKIAKLLGVTEAAISQYKKDKRASTITFPQAINKEITKSAYAIMSNQESVFNEIMRVNEIIKQSGLFCKIHREKSWTPDGCESVCQKHFFRGGI